MIIMTITITITITIPTSVIIAAVTFNLVLTDVATTCAIHNAFVAGKLCLHTLPAHCYYHFTVTIASSITTAGLLVCWSAGLLVCC